MIFFTLCRLTFNIGLVLGHIVTQFCNGFAQLSHILVQLPYLCLQHFNRFSVFFDFFAKLAVSWSHQTVNLPNAISSSFISFLAVADMSFSMLMTFCTPATDLTACVSTMEAEDAV